MVPAPAAPKLTAVASARPAPLIVMDWPPETAPEVALRLSTVGQPSPPCRAMARFCSWGVPRPVAGLKPFEAAYRPLIRPGEVVVPRGDVGEVRSAARRRVQGRARRGRPWSCSPGWCRPGTRRGRAPPRSCRRSRASRPSRRPRRGGGPHRGRDRARPVHSAHSRAQAAMATGATPPRTLLRRPRSPAPAGSPRRSARGSCSRPSGSRSPRRSASFRPHSPRRVDSPDRRPPARSRRRSRSNPPSPSHPTRRSWSGPAWPCARRCCSPAWRHPGRCPARKSPNWC